MSVSSSWQHILSYTQVGQQNGHKHLQDSYVQHRPSEQYKLTIPKQLVLVSCRRDNNIPAALTLDTKTHAHYTKAQESFNPRKVNKRSKSSEIITSSQKEEKGKGIEENPSLDALDDPGDVEASVGGEGGVPLALAQGLAALGPEPGGRDLVLAFGTDRVEMIEGFIFPRAEQVQDLPDPGIHS